MIEVPPYHPGESSWRIGGRVEGSEGSESGEAED